MYELEQDIQMMKQIVTKPFDKDTELVQLKMDVAKLEREIAIRIQTHQMKDYSAAESKNTTINESKEVVKKETLVIRMNAKEDKEEEEPGLIKKKLLIKKAGDCECKKMRA